MRPTKSPGAVAALGASKSDPLGSKVFSETKRQKRFAQAPIRAELIASNSCEADGLIACGYAPVLDLCRELVAAGYDPATPLEAWRGETLCLYIRSIGKGAQLTVADDRHGTPRLRRRPGRPQGYVGASPVAQIAKGRGAATASRDAAQSMAPGAQARQRRHPHRIAHAAESADPLLGPEAPGPFGSGSHTDEVAADGIGYGP
jgi:hypothetical protein